MSSPQVGDVLTTPAELDACPTGTIVRKNDHWIFVHQGGIWGVTGAYSRTSADVFDVVDEVTVIWLPPVTRVEFEAVVQDMGCDGIVRPIVNRGITGPWTDLIPFVGSRVRVTVETIGADDE